MAAPATKTIKSLDGKWAIEKAHSDDTDPVLSLQGIGWLIRKTISAAGITQHLRTSTNPEGFSHITIDQFLSGGLKGTQENRTLDWQYRPHSDWLFGDVKGKSRLTTLATVVGEAKQTCAADGAEEDAKFLAEGWLEESANGEVVESYVEAEKGWTAWQVWGFAEVGDKKERWFVRRFVVRKGKDVRRIRLVYRFEGELEG